MHRAHGTLESGDRTYCWESRHDPRIWWTYLDDLQEYQYRISTHTEPEGWHPQKRRHSVHIFSPFVLQETGALINAKQSVESQEGISAQPERQTDVFVELSQCYSGATEAALASYDSLFMQQTLCDFMTSV
uniref:Predicted protein n=1 Tax=Physcomitrium patens TaxID=3218 RepID=A9TUY5_PHYPA|nr:hypothetical protein PHYPA_014372 [Physcomitrium patens]